MSRELSAAVGRRRTRQIAASSALLGLAALLIIGAVKAIQMTAQESPNPNREPFLLVASPDMPDPIFQETVILMLPSATMPLVAGIVINKPTKMTLGKLFSDSPEIKNQAQAVYFGGPVDVTSPAILTRAPRTPATMTHLFKDVYMSFDTGSIREILKRPASGEDTRLFFGRAQWSAEQLHSEILSGAWSISPATAEFVFSPDPDKVWQKLEVRAKMREVISNFGVFARSPESQ